VTGLQEYHHGHDESAEDQTSRGVGGPQMGDVIYARSSSTSPDAEDNNVPHLYSRTSKDATSRPSPKRVTFPDSPIESEEEEEVAYATAASSAFPIIPCMHRNTSIAIDPISAGTDAQGYELCGTIAGGSTAESSVGDTAYDFDCRDGGVSPSTAMHPVQQPSADRPMIKGRSVRNAIAIPNLILPPAPSSTTDTAGYELCDGGSIAGDFLNIMNGETGDGYELCAAGNAPEDFLNGELCAP
jgi:hypothetical protein